MEDASKSSSKRKAAACDAAFAHGRSKRRPVSPSEARDWTSLHWDITKLIADRLLDEDVTEYIVFRAVCKHWRASTPSPRDPTLADHRFHPRGWVALCDGTGVRAVDDEAITFFHSTSSKVRRVHLWELQGQRIVGFTDGLILLLDTGTSVVRVLHPFTRVTVRLPHLVSFFHHLLSKHASLTMESFACLHAAVCLAASPGSSSIAVVVWFPNAPVVVCAKPSSKCWAIIHSAGAGLPVDERVDPVVAEVPKDLGHPRNCRYYLVESMGAMLVAVLHKVSSENFNAFALFNVDLYRHEVARVPCLRDQALFLGNDRCLSVSATDLPSVSGNAIYFAMPKVCKPVMVHALSDGSFERLTTVCLEHDDGAVMTRRMSVRPFTLADHLLTYCNHREWTRGLMFHEFYFIPDCWDELKKRFAFQDSEINQLKRIQIPNLVSYMNSLDHIRVPMDELNPMSLMIALKTMGKPVSMLYAHRRRLLPVFIGTYLLHLVLTVLLVNLASPVANLDSMGLLYEIDGNSIVPSSKLHLTVTGELFWTLSSAITMVSFSKAFREDSRRAGTRKVEQSRSIATPTWRKWYGFAHAVVTWVALVQLLYEILEANMLSRFHDLVYFIDSVCMFTVVVTSEEGIYGLPAIQRACKLVSSRLEDIPALVVTHVLMQDALEYIYWRAFSKRKMKVSLVIREDTAAEVFRFSAIAASVTVIQQSFECAVVLAFYKRQVFTKPRLHHVPRRVHALARVDTDPTLADRRFHPRGWVALCDGTGVRAVDEEAITFFNPSSGKVRRVHLWELHGHRIVGFTDGLVLLLDTGTSVVRVLHPFTRVVVQLPTLAGFFHRVLSKQPGFKMDSFVWLSAAVCVASPNSSSTSIDVVVWFPNMPVVIWAQPSSEYWVVIHTNIQFTNTLPFDGRLYGVTWVGRQLVQVYPVHEHVDPIVAEVPKDLGHPMSCRYYLVESMGAMLVAVLHWIPGRIKSSSGAFTLFQVDLGSHALTRVPSLGNRALYVPRR
ncbi:hypothetical protein PR202_gb27544 [Eleusine coracana subsp. coracana]|uniref:KIB1-4 beta-propeller domain-containing protein n=1 Tax=Eleusine coracana subsp. coracana TaxID=191504 RepID=A0AAV5FUT9_ELECO|nr:hypothetical protein PR202_gb27544 [Eleusine coracana subsp. coracana]